MMAEYPRVDIEKILEDRMKFIRDISTQAPAGRKILDECLDIAELLIQKNKSYGSSYSHPINIFSKSTPKEQIFIRIDDKLNRIHKGKEYASEDTILDLIGYLVLLRTLDDNR
jgi:hypothetical protein